MFDYSMVRPYRPNPSAKISQLSRKLLSTKRVRVGSTEQVREIVKCMPLESPVGPQNRMNLIKPPIQWIAGRKGEFVNVIRFDGFTDPTSLDIPTIPDLEA
jgi:hypothetical protein